MSLRSTRLRDAGTGPSPRGILVLVLIGQFLLIASMGSINIALLPIQEALAATPAGIQWVLVLFQLGFAVLLITGGRLGDVFGVKRLFLIGLSGFTAASALAALSPDIATLMVARLLQGLAAGLAAPQILAIIQVTFPPAARRSALGVFAMVSACAFTVGQLATGALLTLGLGWRATFWFFVPLGLIATLGSARSLPESRRKDREPMDVIGVGLVTVIGLAVLFPLIQGRAHGWPTSYILMLAATVPLMFVFTRYERVREARGLRTLVNLDLFGSRTFSVGLGLSALFGLAGFSQVVFLTILFRFGVGLDPLQTALAISPLPLAMMAASLLSSRVMQRVGRGLFAYSSASMALGALLVTVRLSQGDGTGAFDLLPGLVFLGVGHGFAFGPAVAVSLNEVHDRDAGSASGVVQTVQQLSSAVGVAIFGVLYFGVLAEDTPAEHFAAAEAVMLAVLGLVALFFALHFALPKSMGRKQPDHLVGSGARRIRRGPTRAGDSRRDRSRAQTPP
jgi:MFS family permease